MQYNLEWGCHLSNERNKDLATVSNYIYLKTWHKQANGAAFLLVGFHAGFDESTIIGEKVFCIGYRTRANQDN